MLRRRCVPPQPLDAHTRQINGHLIVEPGRASAAELGDIYRDVTVSCIEKQIRRLLVKLRDADPAAERALRIAMTTMVLAGLPAQFQDFRGRGRCGALVG